MNLNKISDTTQSNSPKSGTPIKLIRTEINKMGRVAEAKGTKIKFKNKDPQLKDLKKYIKKGQVPKLADKETVTFSVKRFLLLGNKRKSKTSFK